MRRLSARARTFVRTHSGPDGLLPVQLAIRLRSWVRRQPERARMEWRQHRRHGLQLVPVAPGHSVAFQEGPRPPEVSIVVPVYNHLELTRRCLAAVAAHTDLSLIELIVVDDASTDATPAWLDRTTGIRVLRQDPNQGVGAAMARGAAAARGRHILFLNNDTEPQPRWLDALVDALALPGVVAAGSRLVYPSGLMQECGAVVTRDGSGVNLGNGRDPDSPEWRHVRDVDYCSAAALLVRRSAFEQVGGFDVRFRPAYYEDTDLCFALRAAGGRVVVAPRSVVVHHEGASHGTDHRTVESPGPGKLQQYRNREVFVSKWAAALASHPERPLSRWPLAGRERDLPRVLVVAADIPRADRSSGAVRLTAILHQLRRIGCSTTLLPLAAGIGEVHSHVGALEDAGVEVRPVRDLSLLAARSGAFDLVVLSSPGPALAMLRVVRRTQPQAVVIYDSVDLEFLREERRAIAHGEDVAPALALRARELGLVRSTDVTATVTESESELLRHAVPQARTVILPNVHEARSTPVPGPEGREGLLFIGGYSHEPNVDCVRHLAAQVLPLIRRRVGDIGLDALGADPSEALLALRSEHVRIPGHIANVDPWFDRARVFVAPLRYGAGMKGKIGQAMALGLPVVTSTVGAEGMGLTNGVECLIADTPTDVAEAVVRLITDNGLWTSLSVAGVRTVAERWSPERMRERLEGLLDYARPDQPRVRTATKTSGSPS
jgi:GT2 family glycosyltransferase/glycosyltransferase involved in cell wall biosynthesis